MSDRCTECAGVEERTDVPHVVRLCPGCGRELHILEPGAHGKGIKLRKGDRFVFPDGWIKIGPNPLKSRGRLTPAGLDWYAKSVFVKGIPKKSEEYPAFAKDLEDQLDQLLRDSPLLGGRDPQDQQEVNEIGQILNEKKDTDEFWALVSGSFLNAAEEARKAGDAIEASWATALAERARAVLVYRQDFRDVVWMGHSAGRVVQALRTWGEHRTNGDEGFWQLTFREHSYVLSQVFAVPVVFIEESAYVGGMQVDQSGAKIVDYLLSAESSREALLVEIKAPTTRLLGKRYRGGVYGPSSELSGAVVQVLTYRDELTKNLKGALAELDLRTFRPRCVLIAGDGSVELSSPEKRRSFELFRASSDVEIVTYDELFRKVEVLAELFSLKRTDRPGPPN